MLALIPSGSGVVKYSTSTSLIYSEVLELQMYALYTPLRVQQLCVTRCNNLREASCCSPLKRYTIQ